MASNQGRKSSGWLATATAFLVAALSLVLLNWVVRLTYADVLFRRGDLQSLMGAIRLVPTNADYYARLAELAFEAGKPPQESLAALRRAVELSPHDSELWMELGLSAEIAGDLATAEKCLLEAARRDRTYQPRATLAHYYCRRNDQHNFWPWVSQALQIAQGDVRPLFRLCWEMSDDAELIRRRAIPDRPEILRQYLDFLLSTRRWQAARAIGEQLARAPGAEDVPALLGYCDSLLEARQVETALGIWNGLAAKGAIPHRPLAPERGELLTDGDFASAPSLHGFDWRLYEIEGVTVTRDRKPPSLRIFFSGRQPERCLILWQWLPLAAACKYRLRFLYRTEGISPGAGPRWQLLDCSKQEKLLGQTEPLAAEEWREGELEFATGPDCRLGRLAFSYQRELGTTRIAGSIWLAWVRLEPLR